MSREITMGNLFSGSGTWELAAKMLGIKVVFEAEIEPFPVAVEAKRFPEAIQLGDVSEINGAEIPPVDILTNSSPCQGLSVAGMRKGLDDERSGLFSEAIRITKEMRQADELRMRGSDDHIQPLSPQFWCWENVPGALSSNRGEDFRTVLEDVARLVQEDAVIPLPPKGWSNAGVVDLENGQIAWRILDAQFELPQRRRRIFLVADLNGHRAESVLFEREGLCWNFKEIADTWKDTSRSLADRIALTGEIIDRGVRRTEEGMVRDEAVMPEKN